jgi:hypothetical protein
VVPNTGKTGKTTIVIERLSPAWMKLRFHSKFLKLVRMAAERKDSYGRWIFIPAGKARVDKMAPIDMRTVVPVRYTQNENDTCLLKSFASALHFLKKPGLSNYFSQVASQYVHIPLDKQMSMLCDSARARDPGILITKWFTKKRVEELDVFTGTNPKWALLVIPLGCDGGIGHAITIVGDYIFDSTQTHALKLDKKSLDWCCANDRGFQRIFMAVRFTWRKIKLISA